MFYIARTSEDCYPYELSTSVSKIQNIVEWNRYTNYLYIVYSLGEV